MRSRVIILLGLFLWCFLLSTQVYGEDAQVCMGCHGDKETMKSMGGAGARPLYVDQAALLGSVHGSLDCSACHQDISVEDHQKKGPKAGRKSSNTCKSCHTAFQGVHAALVDGKMGNPACTLCHGAHAVKSVKLAWDSENCLNCHGKALYLSLGDGTKLSLKIDRSHIDNSVHRMLTCSDCHFGFSSQVHPHRKFESKRDYSVTSAAACKRCHFKEYSETLKSAHNKVSAAAVCSDCHGSHAIVASLELKAMNPSPCAKCHQDTYDAFARSVHGVARIKSGNQDAPTCLNCHGAHAISDPKSAAFHFLVPEMCGKCHSDEKRIGKYGISSTVVKTYNQDFHGITQGFYKQKKDGTRHPATCTDCHGTHDIAGMDQANSPKNKAYLEQKCLRCHPDAPAGFSDSSIPHYQAGFAAAPTVFAINLFYKLFIGIMVIGLFVQIMLHIWRIFKCNEEKNHGN